VKKAISYQQSAISHRPSAISDRRDAPGLLSGRIFRVHWLGLADG